jgi:hypothetical protein
MNRPSSGSLSERPTGLVSERRAHGRISTLADGWTRVRARVTPFLPQRDTSFWRNDLIRKCLERTLEKHAIVAGVDADNAGSLVFDERLGFVRVAHFREIGYKFGRSLDLVFLQRTLSRRAAPDIGVPRRDGSQPHRLDEPRLTDA